MAKVLILSLVFPPDNVSTAQLMGELARDLSRLGHAVRVVTTVPHYNPPTEASPLKRIAGVLLQGSNFADIPVTHVWVPRKGRNLVVRAFGWMVFHLIGTIVACFSSFRPDVIFSPSPPLTIGASAWFIARVRRAKYVYNVQEIYPDVAIHLGVLRSKMLIRLATALERFVYRGASAVTTISSGMQRKLAAKGVNSTKLHLIPNFVDLSSFQELPKRNAFSTEHRISEKFVVSYAGNMGKPQALDIFVEAMVYLRKRTDIVLLMVGSGSEFPRLKAVAQARGLDNVRFLPQQPYPMVPAIYASCELNIVSQTAGTTSDGIPSKVYRIMGSGRAVLAYTDAASDLGHLVNDSGGGIVVMTQDPEEMARIIEGAATNPTRLQDMGRCAREYVARSFSREKVSSQYSDLIGTLSVTARRGQSED